MSKKLIELGGFDYIPAINTGNIRGIRHNGG